MASRPAQPTVAFVSRISTDVDAQRRRLQARLRCSMGTLIGHALRALEISLEKNAPAVTGAKKENDNVSNTLGGPPAQ
jgi:hypothetical protein